MKRRIFLRGLGGASLAAPFLTSLQTKSAKAAGEGPVRSVIFYTHNGCLTNRWFPKVEDGALTPDAFAGTTLAGLADFADKVVVPRGLKMYNGYGEIQTIDPHDQAMGSKLTCATINDDNQRYATSHSIDHEIANQVNPGGAAPLVLSIGSSSSNIKEVMSFSGPGTAFPGTSNPQTVYNALTQLYGTGTPADPATVDDYRVSRGESIIDVVRPDLESFQALNMSASDKNKVKDWLELLRSTEVAIVSAACTEDAAGQLGITDQTVKDSSGGGGGGGGGFGGGSSTAMTVGSEMMMRLLALNMICDSNRSMILAWPGFATFNWDGLTHDKDHHGLSHRNGSAAVGGECYSGVLDRINEIDQWYAKKYVELVTILDSVKEGDRSLLDNSMVTWIPELADGNAHNTNNLPIIITGSGGGYLKQGYAVNLEGKTLGTGNSEADCADGDTSVGFGTGSNAGTVPINKLLVTIANATGAKGPDGGPMTSWGQFDSRNLDAGITNPGELDALRAT